MKKTIIVFITVLFFMLSVPAFSDTPEVADRSPTHEGADFTANANTTEANVAVADIGDPAIVNPFACYNGLANATLTNELFTTLKTEELSTSTRNQTQDQCSQPRRSTELNDFLKLGKISQSGGGNDTAIPTALNVFTAVTIQTTNNGNNKSAIVRKDIIGNPPNLNLNAVPFAKQISEPMIC